MDTDDLTPMAYETLSLAHKVCEPLRAEIGASAADFKAEDEFLHGVSEFMQELLDAPEEYLDSWDLLDDVELEAFVEGARCVKAHVAATLETPIVERGKPPFEE
jgi:hypothetical protein